MGNGKYRLIKEHNKRVSLRCPLSIPVSSINYSKTEGKYSIRFTLYNDGNGALDNDTASSAVIVLRCTDKSGNVVRFGENDYFARTINFGEPGLPGGKSVSMSIMLGIPGGVQISDFEVYISRIRFAGKEVQDYIRGDFFEMPAKPVPIASKLSDAQSEKVLSELGEQAVYIPEELSPVVWRCTCGELCDDAVCPTCGSKKEAVMALFAEFALPARAARELNKQKGKDGRKFNPLPIIIPVAAAIAAAAVIIILVRSCGKKPDPAATDTTTTTDDVVTEPVSINAKDAALAHVNKHEFDKALAAAINGGCDSDVIRYILEEAVKFSVSSANYEKAYSYARQMSDTGYADELIGAAYDEYLNAGNYAGALKAAEALGDEEKASAVAGKAVEALLNAGDYAKAYETAAGYGRTDLAEQILETGLETYLEALDYESALALARLADDSEEITVISSAAAEYYIGIGDLETASAYAAASGDPAVLTELCGKLSDQALSRSFPYYFAYMSTEKKRSLLASSVSAGDYAACITADGKVLYGVGKQYAPLSGKSAVSVASSGRHTAVLLSDGSVVALGDNAYGQCNVSGWSDIVMIAVGRYHTVGLTSAGTVVCTGRGNFGQTSVGTINDAAMISAGEYTTLVLKQDGTVAAFGLNTDLQCDVGSWKDIVYISAGNVHSVGITSAGTAVACGSDLLGMSTVGSWTSLSKIYAGGSYTLAVDTNGKYLLAGGVIGGSLGSTSALSPAEYVDAGDGYILAIFPDGSVEAFGSLAPDMTLIKNVISPPGEAESDPV